MAPPIGGKVWFRSVSVFLGRGRYGNLDLGESVGVVIATAAVEAIGEEQIEALRDAMGERAWRAALNMFADPESIGQRIAKAFDLDLAKPADMRRAKVLYGRLRADGVLIEERVP